ncbi:response regulator [bacterium]|nr:response regulator [bacterium]
MKRLLVVEDEDIILKALRRLLERNHYEVHCAISVDEAIAADLTSFDLILADLRLPGDLGTAMIPLADPIPVVIMTSHASVRSAVDAMRHGAIDYIAKPFDHDELLMVIERSLHQNLMQSQNRALKLSMERLHSVQNRIRDTQLQRCLENINTSERAPRFLHLHGERGTDKESLALAVHESSAQKDGPLLILDISSVENEAETLLLGSLIPATQGAGDERKRSSGLPSGGYLQAAQNGTLVLRQPELLSKETQLALCSAVTGSVLQNPGQARVRAVNIICISTQSLEALRDSGAIIADFADMFGTEQHEVLPLRKRARDIPLLAERQLELLGKRYGSKKLKISEDAMAALMANAWPGNVAELTSLLSRAALVCRTNTIDLSDLGLQSQPDKSLSGSRDLSLDEYFRFFVIRNQSSLSETELAARLGISRKALWERRQKMGLLRDTNDDLSS